MLWLLFSALCEAESKRSFTLEQLSFDNLLNHSSKERSQISGQNMMVVLSGGHLNKHLLIYYCVTLSL